LKKSHRSMRRCLGWIDFRNRAVRLRLIVLRMSGSHRIPPPSDPPASDADTMYFRPSVSAPSVPLSNHLLFCLIMIAHYITARRPGDQLDVGSAQKQMRAASV
jgi:hypothetical protein